MVFLLWVINIWLYKIVPKPVEKENNGPKKTKRKREAVERTQETHDSQFPTQETEFATTLESEGTVPASLPQEMQEEIPSTFPITEVDEIEQEEPKNNIENSLE